MGEWVGTNIWYVGNGKKCLSLTVFEFATPLLHPAVCLLYQKKIKNNLICAMSTTNWVESNFIILCIRTYIFWDIYSTSKRVHKVIFGEGGESMKKNIVFYITIIKKYCIKFITLKEFSVRRVEASYPFCPLTVPVQGRY